MIGFGQVGLTSLLFELIDCNDSRAFLESQGWKDKLNNYSENMINYSEIKLSKYINLNPENSSRYDFTIKEYTNYSNIVMLRIYDKDFYDEFKQVIISSAYKQTSQDVASNIIKTVYKKIPLEITFEEVLNNYYQITLLNYKEKDRRAQEYIEKELYLEIEEEEDDNEVLMVAETMPKFKCMKFYGDYREYCGGAGIMKFIQQNVEYPPLARENHITGKVYVSFIVDTSGSVTNVKIARGVNKHLDAEAIRVVKLFPKYKPGIQRGKPVRVMFTIPFNFTLN